MREVVSAGRVPALVAVLAGGLGRRVGGTKALVELEGRTLISYPLRAADEAGLEAIVVAKRDTELPPLDAAVVREPDVPRHPLCGIITALRHASRAGEDSRGVLAIACDMPFLTAPLLSRFAHSPDEALVAELAGALHPFPALYGPDTLDALAAELEAERPLREVLRGLGARTVSEDELRAFGDPHRLLFTVNRARDLDTARAWMSSRR